MDIRNLFRGRRATSGATGSEAASKALREAQARAEHTESLEADVERATGRAIADIKYWNIGIPRPDPGHNRQEITELKLKVREAGILAQATQLELESDKRILQAAKGLKSLAEGIDKTNEERKPVRKELNDLRVDLFKTYPSTE